MKYSMRAEGNLVRSEEIELKEKSWMKMVYNLVKMSHGYWS